MAGAKLVCRKKFFVMYSTVKHSKSIDLNVNIKIEDKCKLAGNLSVLN